MARYLRRGLLLKISLSRYMALFSEMRSRGHRISVPAKSRGGLLWLAAASAKTTHSQPLTGATGGMSVESLGHSWVSPWQHLYTYSFDKICRCLLAAWETWHMTTKASVPPWNWVLRRTCAAEKSPTAFWVAPPVIHLAFFGHLTWAMSLNVCCHPPHRNSCG